jgi:hypothetical protein
MLNLNLEILLYFIAIISSMGWCYSWYLLKNKNDELLEIKKNNNNLQYDDNYNYHIIDEKIDV